MHTYKHKEQVSQRDWLLNAKVWKTINQNEGFILYKLGFETLKLSRQRNNVWAMWKPNDNSSKTKTLRVHM